MYLTTNIRNICIHWVVLQKCENIKTLSYFVAYDQEKKNKNSYRIIEIIITIMHFHCKK